MIIVRKPIIFLFLVLLLILTGCSQAAKKRSIVVSTAIKQVGVKYKSGHHSPSSGFDCSGLVYYSYKMAGLNIPRTSTLQYSYSKKVWFSKKPGDLLFFNTNKHWWNFCSKSNINHVGIYIGDNKMVHAPKNGSNVTIVKNVFQNKYWKKYYCNTRRIIE